MKKGSWILIAFAGLVILSLGRVYANPDSLTSRALRTLHSGLPHFYNYPGLTLYAGALAYAPLELWQSLTGGEPVQAIYDKSLSSREYADRDVEWPIRVMVLFFSLLAIGSVYYIVQLYTADRFAAGIASLSLLFAPLWLRDSILPTVDIPLAGTCIFAVAVLAHWIRSQDSLDGHWLITFAACIAAAASAKYNGALVAISFFVAIIFSGKKNKTVRDVIRALFRMSVLAIFIFILFNPGILLDFGLWAKDFIYELRHSRAPELGYGVTGFSLWYHLRVNFPDGFGLMPSIIGLLGMIAYYHRIPRSLRVVLFTFPVVFLLFMGISVLPFARYMLPLFPFLAIGIGFFFARTREIARSIPFLSLCACTLLIPGFIFGLRLAIINRVPDTRHDLMDLTANVKLSRFITTTGYLESIIKRATYADTKRSKSAVKQIEMAFADSFSIDRIVASGGERKNPLRNFEKGTVLVINPFFVEKNLVPFSPESIYGSYVPDLPYRSRPGPYIEIYLLPGFNSAPYSAWCQARPMQCSVKEAKNGYYYQHL